MNRRNHIFGLGLLLVATMAAPRTASAQQPAAQLPSASSSTDFPACTKTVDADGAHTKFIAARQDYEEANYDSALRRFRDAYNFDCTKPELLLLFSSTWERKGNTKEALAALDMFVQRAPKDHPDMATTQAKIENLRRQLAATPPPTTNPPVEERGHTVYPWLVVGAGVVGAGVGVVLVATAPARPANCVNAKSTCTQAPGQSDRDFADDRERAGRAKNQPLIGALVIGGGGLLIAGGLIWHFLEPTGPKEKTARSLTPTVAPGFAGLSYTGSF